MKALIFSDLHGHNFKEFSEIVDGVNSRLIEQLNCLDRIVLDVDEKHIDVVWFLGDLFHLKNNLDSQVIRLIVEKFLILSSLVPIWMISGNHDYRIWDREASILSVLKEARKEKIKVFAEEQQYVGWEDWNIFISPYSRRPDVVNKGIENFSGEADVFLGHQDIAGVSYNGFVVDKGLDTKTLVKKFKYNFVGHCHDSFLVCPGVVSVGAPLQLSFNEMHQRKGWWILDSESGEVTFKENDKSPQFKELILEEEQKIDFQDNKNYYRIKTKGLVAPEGIERIKWRRLSFESIKGISKDRSKIKFSDSVEQLLDKYIKARNLNDLDEKKLLEVGRRYLG